MKFLYVVPLVFALTLGYQLEDSEHHLIGKANILKKEYFKQFIHSAKILNIIKDTKSANLNEFTDRTLSNLNQAILNAGSDPADVPDQSINIGIGKSTLTEGSVSKIATIERYEDVTLKYNNETKKITFELTLRWEDIEMIYKYHTIVTLISTTGHVHANVAHAKFHIKGDFDFNTYHLILDTFNFKHTGDITVKFSGNKVLDYILNAMTKVFTTIFHNLILETVKKVAMDPVEGLVNTINNLIDSITHH